MLSSTHFFVYRTLNTNKKVKYKNFLHEVGRSWITEVQNRSESNFDDLQLSEKQTPWGPKHDPWGRISGNFRIRKLEKLLLVGREKRSILQGIVVCAAHKQQSETRYICKLCVVLLRKVFFWEIPFSEELLDYLHAVSAVSGSGAKSIVSNREYVMGLNIRSI